MHNIIHRPHEWSKNKHCVIFYFFFTDNDFCFGPLNQYIHIMLISIIRVQQHHTEKVKLSHFYMLLFLDSNSSKEETKGTSESALPPRGFRTAVGVGCTDPLVRRQMHGGAVIKAQQGFGNVRFKNCDNYVCQCL